MPQYDIVPVRGWALAVAFLIAGGGADEQRLALGQETAATGPAIAPDAVDPALCGRGKRPPPDRKYEGQRLVARDARLLGQHLRRIDLSASSQSGSSPTGRRGSNPSALRSASSARLRQTVHERLEHRAAERIATRVIEYDQDIHPFPFPSGRLSGGETALI